MSQARKARDLIETLEKGRFYAECPCCGEPMLLAEAGLFSLDDFTPEALERYRQMLEDQKERRKALKDRKTEIPARSERGAESVNIGFILERIAPAMKTFSFDRNDCRSVFDPIDYVIFEGLSRGRKVDRIIFADIKTGKATLAKKQREIRGVVEKKRVEFDVYDATREK